MRPHRSSHRALVALSAALIPAIALATGGAGASPTPTRTLVPIGSDYQPDTLQRFAAAAAAHDSSGRVVILVLPITYGTSAASTTTTERRKNLKLADERRAQVQAACDAVRRADQACDAQLVPTLVRSDAFLASNLAYFTSDVDGMYVLGGDQTVGMGVAADTPLEQAMTAAYDSGAVFGGNSAGDAVQSVNMINGYVGDNGPAESLRQGTVELWTSEGVHDTTRGLIFGLTEAIDEQHVFERGRIGRAVNVAVTSGLPVIGMDAATGAAIVDETTLTDVVGFTGGIVVDPATYGATATPGGPTSTLSIRNVATHLIAPGSDGYDLATLRPTESGVPVGAPSIAGRDYPSLGTPAGAGTLLVSGGFAGAPAGPIGQSLVTAAGGASARIVVLTTGYAKSGEAQAAAKSIAAALQPGVTATVTWIVLDARTNVAAATAAISSATGIVLTSPDPSRVKGALDGQPAVVAAIGARWSSGAAALLADDAAAAAIGPWFTADALPTDIEVAASEDFLASGVTIRQGLGWIGTALTPQLLPGYRWGQAYQLLAAHPAQLSIGLDTGTALRVSAGSATVVGDSAVVVLDGRQAAFEQGSNGALSATWVLLDTFVSGDPLAV